MHFVISASLRKGCRAVVALLPFLLWGTNLLVFSSVGGNSLTGLIFLCVKLLCF